MGFFSRLFGRVSKESPAENRLVKTDKTRQIFQFSDIPQIEETESDANTYPLKDAPVPVISTDEVIKSQGQLIQSIKRAIPLTNEECDEFLFPVIYNLAELVHLIPASNFYHHKGRGGLFRHSLEVALYSVNIAKTHIFGAGQSAEENFRNTGRWYLACCLAGLLHDAGKVLTSVTVSGKEGRTVWHPLSESITQWAAREGIENYNIAWNTKADTYELHMLATPLFFWKLVGLPTRRYLEEANSLMLISELVKALSGDSDTQALIPNLVKKADARSTQLDIEYQNKSKVTPGVDTPICSIVEGIIATLIEANRWQANHFGLEGKLLSPLLITAHGVFLVWKLAYADIVKELDKRSVGAVPRNADILAEKLCEGGLCEFNKSEGVNQPVWKVVPAAGVPGVDPEEAKILLPQGIKLNGSDSTQIFEEEPGALTEEEQAALNAELREEMAVSLENADAISEFGEVPAEDDEEETESVKTKLKTMEFNFQTSLRLADDVNIFVHVKRPAATLVLVKGLPLEVNEVRRWMELTQSYPPKTSNSSEDEKIILEAVGAYEKDEPEEAIENDVTGEKSDSVDAIEDKNSKPSNSTLKEKDYQEESKQKEPVKINLETAPKQKEKSPEKKKTNNSKKVKKTVTGSKNEEQSKAVEAKDTKLTKASKNEKTSPKKETQNDEKFSRRNFLEKNHSEDKKEKAPGEEKALTKKVAKSSVNGIEKKTTQEKATEVQQKEPKTVTEEAKDFKNTEAGQRAERKKAPAADALKPSKGDQIFEVLALGLIKQLKAGKGPMLSNTVLEDGERKTDDEVIAKVLKAKDLSVEDFFTYIDRSPDPLLRCDRDHHQFCLRIKD